MLSQPEGCLLCLVVPCYNEEEMLPTFFREAIPAIEEITGGRWRIVCVDDGSVDGTFDCIAWQHAADPRVAGIRLSRNFGHQAALSAGLAYARGEYVGVIDCDLQDPIEVLVHLYRTAVRKNLDACYGVRGRRDAPLFLRACYSLFYFGMRRAADHPWPRDAGDFCVMSARCHRTILALPERSRMLRGLRAWVGFRQAGHVYDRPSRARGKSKYNIRKLTALAMQGLIAFSSIPLRLASLAGLLMGLFSICFTVFILANRIFPGFSFLHYWVGSNPGVASILVFVSFAFSILFVCLGVIGEYLVVLLQEIKGRPAAIVDSAIGIEDRSDVRSPSVRDAAV